MAEMKKLNGKGNKWELLEGMVVDKEFLAEVRTEAQHFLAPNVADIMFTMQG